jgi:hypothetical protein
MPEVVIARRLSSSSPAQAGDPVNTGSVIGYWIIRVRG